jgi:hypothetical protein
MELFKAHQQWANRPDDERFTSLQELYAACKAYADSARERDANFEDIRAEAVAGDVQIIGKGGIGAKLTNWAFGQLAARIAAPASYLRELPATLAAQNLNHGLAKFKGMGKDRIARLLFHVSQDALLLRAITSDEYARIWNYEIAERLIDLAGWEPARPDIRVQDDRLPLYASDHDMFAFLRSVDKTVNEGNGEPMWKGVIAENSEVGASSLKLTRFFYREMCGNHIIWGASKVVDFNVRHIGQARERWGHFAVQVRQWSDSTVREEEAMIQKAKTTVISATKEGVLDAVFGKRSVGLSRKAVAAGYDAVNVAEDGEPNTVWGLVQGLTRESQRTTHADKRTAMDRAAGKLLEVDF